MTTPLQQKVQDLASEHGVPGVAVGVLHEGKEDYAFHGVTSVENPLEVDEKTLFQFGSTGKTYTATAILRLVEQGRVSLDAPVRTYVPELRLKDEEVAATVTVLHLLNHTAGWEGDLLDDTGSGDDALARYVELMAGLTQTSPPGKIVSYNNASLSLAGRVIEKVTGEVFETAMRQLVLDPLRLDHTFFFPNEIMTRRFAVGHTRHEDGRTTVLRPWKMARSADPAGGMSANAGDQIAWARFHLGDGRAPDGTTLLTASALRKMQERTASMAGSALGDAVGITWMLREVEGVKMVSHGGTTIGQHSEFVMAPERGFAFISMTNCGPNGPELNHLLHAWVLSEYLGIVEREPEQLSLPAEQLAEYAGRYETVAAVCDLYPEGGHLVARVEIRPEVAKKLYESGEEVEEQPPIPLALLEGPDDRFVVPDGPAKGMKGYFTRDREGRIEGVHLGGRLATRVASPEPG
ncbi:MAG: serine hydrolase domain-containing protein [Acidimicrobiales bacterium]